MPKLKAAIQEFIDAHQANPKPYVWTKTADQILASIARFAQRTFELQAAQHVFTNHWDRTPACSKRKHIVPHLWMPPS